MISSHDTLWIVDEKNEDDTKKGCQKKNFQMSWHTTMKTKKERKTFTLNVWPFYHANLFKWRILSFSISFLKQKDEFFTHLRVTWCQHGVFTVLVLFFGEGRGKKAQKKVTRYSLLSTSLLLVLAYLKVGWKKVKMKMKRNRN